MKHKVFNGTANCLIYTPIKNRTLRNIWANGWVSLKGNVAKIQGAFLFIFTVHKFPNQSGNKNNTKRWWSVKQQLTKVASIFNLGCYYLISTHWGLLCLAPEADRGSAVVQNKEAVACALSVQCWGGFIHLWAKMARQHLTCGLHVVTRIAMEAVTRVKQNPRSLLICPRSLSFIFMLPLQWCPVFLKVTFSAFLFLLLFSPSLWADEPRHPCPGQLHWLHVSG